MPASGPGGDLGKLLPLIWILVFMTHSQCFLEALEQKGRRLQSRINEPYHRSRDRGLMRFRKAVAREHARERDFDDRYDGIANRRARERDFDDGYDVIVNRRGEPVAVYDSELPDDQVEIQRFQSQRSPDETERYSKNRVQDITVSQEQQQTYGGPPPVLNSVDAASVAAPQPDALLRFQQPIMQTNRFQGSSPFMPQYAVPQAGAPALPRAYYNTLPAQPFTSNQGPLPIGLQPAPISTYPNVQNPMQGVPMNGLGFPATLYGGASYPFAGQQ